MNDILKDFRFDREGWAEQKPKSPTGLAPFLEIHENGNVQKLAESMTIGK